MRKLFPILAWLVATAAATAASADCPDASDIDAAIDRLSAQARAAPDAATGQAAAGAMWREWMRAPDAQAQEWLDEGLMRMRVRDLPGSRRAFDTLVAYCPEYAEGWNQRAFLSFQEGDFAAALTDLDRAYAIDQRHVGVLTGRALTLIALDRLAEGQADIRAALDINPWLSEKRFLDLDPETGTPRPPQTDL